jgi:hypothetical protein
VTFFSGPTKLLSIVAVTVIGAPSAPEARLAAATHTEVALSHV